MKPLAPYFGVAAFILTFMLGWSGAEWLADSWGVSSGTEFMMKVFGASLTCGLVLDCARRGKVSSEDRSPSSEESVGGGGGGFSIAPHRLPGKGDDKINGRQF